MTVVTRFRSVPQARRLRFGIGGCCMTADGSGGDEGRHFKKGTMMNRKFGISSIKVSLIAALLGSMFALGVSTGCQNPPKGDCGSCESKACPAGCTKACCADKAKPAAK